MFCCCMNSDDVVTEPLTHNTTSSDASQLSALLPVALTSRIGIPRELPDREMDACFSCDKPFSAIHRKHHCRRCGLLFCETCSNNHTPVLITRQKSSQRLCVECYSRVLVENQFIERHLPILSNSQIFERETSSWMNLKKGHESVEIQINSTYDGIEIKPLNNSNQSNLVTFLFSNISTVSSPTVNSIQITFNNNREQVLLTSSSRCQEWSNSLQAAMNLLIDGLNYCDIVEERRVKKAKDKVDSIARVEKLDRQFKQQEEYDSIKDKYSKRRT